MSLDIIYMEFMSKTEAIQEIATHEKINMLCEVACADTNSKSVQQGFSDFVTTRIPKIINKFKPLPSSLSAKSVVLVIISSPY
jgi:hypothetical protein